MKEKSIVKKGVVSVGLLALFVMAAIGLSVSAQDGERMGRRTHLTSL